MSVVPKKVSDRVRAIYYDHCWYCLRCDENDVFRMRSFATICPDCDSAFSDPKQAPKLIFKRGVVESILKEAKSLEEVDHIVQFGSDKIQKEIDKMFSQEKRKRSRSVSSGTSSGSRLKRNFSCLGRGN